MDTDIIIQRTTEEVKRRMAGLGAGHAWDHVQRVVHSSRLIQQEVGGDPLVVELAALLHDVGDAKFHEGVERSGEFTQEILGNIGVPQETIDHIATIVDQISFRKDVDPSELSLEAKIVQDADRLDAIGAIGIVRTIEYGASIGQPFYDPENPDAKSGIAHFDDKLFKLRAKMHTETAKTIARQREQFMRAFLDQFHNEQPSPTSRP